MKKRTKEKLIRSFDLSILFKIESPDYNHKSFRSFFGNIERLRSNGKSIETIAILKTESAPSTPLKLKLSNFDKVISFAELKKINLRGDCVAAVSSTSLINEAFLSFGMQLLSSKDRTLVFHPHMTFYYYPSSYLREAKLPEYTKAKIGTWITGMPLSSTFITSRNHFKKVMELLLTDKHLVDFDPWAWCLSSLYLEGKHRPLHFNAELTQTDKNARQNLPKLNSKLRDFIRSEHHNRETDIELNANITSESWQSNVDVHEYNHLQSIKFFIDKVNNLPIRNTNLLSQLRKFNSFVPKFYPGLKYFEQIESEKNRQSNWGHLEADETNIFQQIISKIPNEKFDYVYFHPWARRGGCERIIVNQFQAIKTANPKSKILIIFHRGSDHPWKELFGKHAEVVDLSTQFQKVGIELGARIFAKLIDVIFPKIVVISNSNFGWHAISKYGGSFPLGTKLYSLEFCFSYLSDGQPTGHVNTYLEDSIPHLSGVLTDNLYFKNFLEKTYDFKTTWFTPTPIACSKKHRLPVPTPNSGTPKILWASRMDNQKRVDILCAVARKLPEIEFHVFGDFTVDNPDPVILNMLETCPNLVRYGKFDNFDEIPVEKFNLFFYTAAWDGRPLIVMEAMARGIFVLAPNVGGISELINEKTGYLVSRANAVDEYVEVIRKVTTGQLEIKSKIKAARKFILENHSTKNFQAALASVPDFFSKPPR